MECSHCKTRPGRKLFYENYVHAFYATGNADVFEDITTKM